MREASCAIAAGIFALWAAGSAVAADSTGKFYVALSAGAAFFEDFEDGGTSIEIDDGYALGGAIGYKFKRLRAELEVSYIETDIEGAYTAGISAPASGDVTIWAGMLNGFYDLHTGTSWVPFIGAGIGVANGEASDVVVAGTPVGDEDGTGLAWQLGAGLRYKFAGGFSIGPEYRYFRIETGNKIDSNVDAHKALITVGAGF